MLRGPLTDSLVDRFDEMPPLLKVAARYVLDHPKDIALMSMREQAGSAGVSHTTMMRLARWLGMESYEEMRALYAEALRQPAGEPGAKRAQGDQVGYAAVSRVSDTLAAQVAALGEYGNATQLAAAADVLAQAGRIYALGLRREYAVALHFAHTLMAARDRITLVDAAGGTGGDMLGKAAPGDAMLVVGLAPYARATVDLARHASRRGLSIVAITDSPVSPLARLARESIIVTSRSNSFFCSIAPALAAAEIVAALLADRWLLDIDAVRKGAEEELGALDVYWKPPR